MTYPSQILNPEWNQEYIPASTAVDAWGLHVSCDSGEITLPYSRLVIEAKGTAEDQVYFSHPDFPGVWLVTDDAWVLLQPGIQERTALKRQIHNLDLRALKKSAETNTEQDSGSLGMSLKWCGIILGFVVMAALGVMMLMNMATALITPSIELAIGESAVAEFTGDFTEFEPDEADWINGIVDRLSKVTGTSDYDYSTSFIMEESPNAMAFPGGIIVITSGLLNFVDGDTDKMAGVLAHEMAHITRRHGLKKYVNSAGPALALQLLVGGDSGITGIITNGSSFLSGLAYSRKMELEADQIAVDYLRKAGFNPDGLTGFLIMLNSISSRYGSSPSILSTHPATDQRIQKLNSITQSIE